MLALDRQAYPYVVSTQPAGDPLFVTPDEARAFLKLDELAVPDADIIPFIKATQSAVEKYTGLTFFTTEFQTKRDRFAPEMVLRKAPLQAVSEIKIVSRGVDVVVDQNIYKIIDDFQLNYGSVVLRAGAIWPAHDNERRAITIVFTAGFGDDYTDLPVDLIAGSLRVLADLWENRGDCACDSGFTSVAESMAAASMSKAALMLLNQFKIMRI